MHELPFQLLINSVSLVSGEQSITCTELLRHIPDKRMVYDALWNGREVIVKVFSRKIYAKRHFKREWRGLTILNKRQLSAPKPLFYGKTEDGSWVVVMEKIFNSASVFDIFQQTTDMQKKLDLIVLVCKELAKQHSKAVMQADLHLGNFLIRDGIVFAIDSAQMHFYFKEPGKNKSLSQLALLTLYFSDSDIESVETLLKEYADVRQWDITKAEESYFKQQRVVQRKKTIRKGLKKSLRTSKRNLKVKSKNYSAVFDRQFCRSTDTADFFEQIDFMMDKGKVLKDGNTCFVSKIKWEEKDIVIKRYNYKGFFHSLRHTIKKSRARRSWLNAQRLEMLSINTPTPLAFIEKRKGWLVLCSYFIAEFTNAPSLYTLLKSSDTTENQRIEVINKVEKLIDRLGKYRITHGDLKHTNIFVSQNSLLLTDLDAMKVHKFNCMYKRRRASDIDHFKKYGQRYSVVMTTVV